MTLKVQLFATLLCFALHPLGAAIAAPVIFWTNDPVAPDETVLVCGEDLGSVDHVTVKSIENRRAAGPSYRVAPIQVSSESLKFVLPHEINNGAYEFSLEGPGGRTSGYLNVPRIAWLQGNEGKQATPGGWIRIVGWNIRRAPDLVLSLSNDHDRVTLRLDHGSDWDAMFRVPPQIAPARYRATLSWGDEAADIGADAGTISIAATRRRTFTLNVKTFGAEGDGVHDDTAAVNAALAELASRGGGTLFFPRGRFRLTSEIRIPRFVALAGESQQLVSLNWPDLDPAPNALLQGDSDFSISDMTIYASNYSAVISGGMELSNFGTKAGNIALERIRIRASAYRGHITAAEMLKRYSAKSKLLNGPTTVALSGDNVRITDSDIYGSGSAFLLWQVHNAYVAGNKFYNGRGGWYSITGSTEVIFEKNQVTGADPEASGGGINTLGRSATFSRNILVRENEFEQFNGWDREALTTDGPGGYYYGRVVVDKNRVRLLDGLTASPPTKSYIGAGIFIVEGSGTGQYSQIIGASGSEIALRDTLSVTSDDPSIATIVPLQENYFIIGNNFHDAGVAVQFYGAAANSVIADNISVRTGGYLARGAFYQHFQPSWHIQFLNNKILEGNVYRGGSNNSVFSGEAVIGVYGLKMDESSPPFSRGIVVRGNSLENNAHIEVEGLKAIGVRDVIIEGNSIMNSAIGISVDAGAELVLNRHNQTDDGANARRNVH